MKKWFSGNGNMKSSIESFSPPEWFYHLKQKSKNISYPKLVENWYDGMIKHLPNKNKWEKYYIHNILNPNIVQKDLLLRKDGANQRVST